MKYDCDTLTTYIDTINDIGIIVFIKTKYEKNIKTASRPNELSPHNI